MPTLSKCITLWCRNQAGAKSKKCSKCQLRIWRKTYPHKALLAIIRQRAKKKKFEFNLTYRPFFIFLRENQWNKQLHEIDRIDPTHGYVWGNIQVLTEHDNRVKGNCERYRQRPNF